MKKAIVLTVFLIACTPKKLMPAKVLTKVLFVSEVSVIVKVIDILEYGHFMAEINRGDQLEIYVHQSYADSVHLMGNYKEFYIKNEHGYWETD